MLLGSVEGMGKNQMGEAKRREGLCPGLHVIRYIHYLLLLLLNRCRMKKNLVVSCLKYYPMYR